MATTSNAATRPLRPAKLTNLFLRGALVRTRVGVPGLYRHQRNLIILSAGKLPTACTGEGGTGVRACSLTS
jgi:hypothetical protein